MKRILALILALMLALGCVSALAEAMPQTDSVLPQTGDVVCGFEVKEIRDFPLVGAQLVLFEHQKTGARLLWVANEDTNRVFQLAFPTRPQDETGLPHVFEHAVLFGSEKYPATTLFFNIRNQTYQTYMNAYTTDACTVFPLASLSEKQLLSLADCYVDACFHPLIITQESIFKTQAWHYDLPDLDGELTYEGVVYSEMLGAMTLQRMALGNANGETFPGAALSYEHGGLPESIPEMTWEDVKNFHEKYYHPSNCLALLYGQFEDYAAFLQLLDDAFFPFERAEFAFEDAGYTPIAEPVVASFAYPMAEGTNVSHQSVVIYYILCPGLRDDPALESLVDHLCSMLNEKASVLNQSFVKAFPAGQVSCGRELAGPEDAICFTATGMNENDAEAFKALVDEAIKAVAENGFPQDMVDSAMASLNLSTKLISENTNPVEGVVYSLTYNYAVSGDPFSYPAYVESLSRIDDENQSGLLKEAAAWLAARELYTLTITYPAPGLKEEQDAALKEKLAAIKAGMTQEELQAIVDETNAAPKEEDTSALMAKIKAVTVESLPEEVKTYAVSDSTDDSGVRHLEAIAGVDGIGQVRLMLDAAALPQEDIHWLRLFTRLLGEMDTDRHTKEELDVLISRYLYSNSIKVSCLEIDDGVHPYLAASWIAADDDLAAGYDLAEELLFHTRFDDTEKLAKLVDAQKTSARAEINNNAYQIMLYRGLADRYPVYRYFSYMNYLEYYAFLEELEQMLSEAPEEAVRHLEAVQAFFANSAGAVAAFAGNEQSIEKNRVLADAFMAKLDHTEREAVTYDLPVPSQREALVIDGQIQFNSLIATEGDLGLDGFDAGLAAITTMVSDKVLVPVLRDQMGVYSPMNGVLDNGSMYLITYRDPSVKETFEVYASLADRIAQMELTQDELDGYIMSAFSELAMPVGELSGALGAIIDVLEGNDPLRTLTYMRQLKAVTPESVKAAAEFYRKAWENGVRSTAGSIAAISANADLYEVILNPFNTQDSTKVELTDAPEGSEHYEGVRFVFEKGIMSALTEDTFGVSENATVGDMAAGIYASLGGPAGDPQGAVDWLAGFGLLDPATDIHAELTEEMLCYVLADGLGVGISTDTPETIVTRGDLADLFFQLFPQ